MTNLLPSKQKREIHQQEVLRLILILGVTVISFLISLSLVLLLVKILILKDIDVEKIILDEKKNEISLHEDWRGIIKNYNSTFSYLNSFYREKINTADILEKISDSLPSGVYLTALNIRVSQTENPKIKKAQKVAEVFLSGYSPTREILLELRENLEEQNYFSEIYFSPENWVTPSDIQFNINLKYIISLPFLSSKKESVSKNQ